MTAANAMTMLRTHRFAGPRVLKVRALPVGKLGVGFLNWHVSSRRMRERGAPRESFQGCGLYGVCFRGRLVYVGSYCGKKPKGVKAGAYFRGDVVGSRWWQHFGSLTARSHKLHVSRGVLSALHGSMPHPLVEQLVKAGDGISKDQGCLGAENRLRFAARYWNRHFENADATRLLRQFSFLYVQVDEAVSLSAHELKASIEAAEREAIEALQPEVNTAGRASDAIARRLSPRQAEAELSGILRRHLDARIAGSS